MSFYYIEKFMVSVHVGLRAPWYFRAMKQFLAILLLLLFSFSSFIGIKCSEDLPSNQNKTTVKVDIVEPDNVKIEELIVASGPEEMETAPTVLTAPHISTDMKTGVETEMKIFTGSLVDKPVPKAQELYVSDTSASSDMPVTAGQLESSIELNPPSSTFNLKTVLIVVFFLVLIIFVLAFMFVYLKQRDNRIHHQDYI